MKYLTIFKFVSLSISFLIIAFVLTGYFTGEHLDRSAISDKPSILIKVWSDNSLSIGGVKYDDSKQTMELRKKEKNKWYLENNRKLTDEELHCLENGFFSTVIIKGHIDIICDNGDKIIYIN